MISFGSRLSWSPDGKLIAVATVGDVVADSREIFVVRVVDGIIKQLTSLGLAMLIQIPTAQSQQPKPPPQSSPSATPNPAQERPEIINIRRVRLPITVTDKKGQFVTGLGAGDFLITEDKVPQQIDSFTSEENNNLPLYIGVLMDTSPSTAGKLKFEQESAMNFIQTVIRPRKDRVLFATFDDQITLRQDFTDRLELLDRAVFAIKKTGEKKLLCLRFPRRPEYSARCRVLNRARSRTKQTETLSGFATRPAAPRSLPEICWRWSARLRRLRESCARNI